MGGEGETLTKSANNNVDAGDLILDDSDAVALSADLDLISGFYRTHLCSDVKQKLAQCSTHGAAAAVAGDPQQQNKHKFLVDCSVLSIEIENEIINILNHIREIYRWRFLDLERLVRRPIDYALAVKRLESEQDPMARADFLQGLLPEPDISTVVGAISRISISPDCNEKLREPLAACDRVLALDSARKKLLDFATKRAELAAPNLSGLVGAATAAKLIGAAGGLKELRAMPLKHLCFLGARTRKAEGFSSAYGEFEGGGYLAQTGIVREYCEPLESIGPVIVNVMRDDCCDLLGHYVGRAAVMDINGKYETGAWGRDMVKEVRGGFERLKKTWNRMNQGGGGAVDAAARKRSRGAPAALAGTQMMM